MTTHRTGIALGSNLGDRAHNLQEATRRLITLHHGSTPILHSPVFETEPRFCPPDSPAFLNAVVEIQWQGSPADLHRATLAIESVLGRARSPVPNAPRIIDVDILYCGDQIIETPTLQLPHPRIQERRFVLTPLVEIRPDLILPLWTMSASAMLAALVNDEPAPTRHPASLL